MRAWATASLVVGIISLSLAFIPYVGLLTFITGPGAVFLGVVALMLGARRKGPARGELSRVLSPAPSRFRLCF